jgi:hypothetical protein
MQVTIARSNKKFWDKLRAWFPFRIWVVPCHQGMERPQVDGGGDGLQMLRVAANILNTQSRTADKGWSPSLGAGSGANNASL